MVVKNKQKKRLKVQSPSLTIMKPNLSSLFSIFNRILGILWYFIILFFLPLTFFIKIWYNVLLNQDWDVMLNYNTDFDIYIIFSDNLLIGMIMFIHLFYSISKIFLKKEKFYQLISSSSNVILDHLNWEIIVIFISGLIFQIIWFQSGLFTGPLFPFIFGIIFIGICKYLIWMLKNLNTNKKNG